MKLRDWIEGAGITQREFAKLVEASEAKVSLIANDKEWLSRELAQRIAEATDGAVTANDFAGIEPTQ